MENGGCEAPGNPPGGAVRAPATAQRKGEEALAGAVSGLAELVRLPPLEPDRGQVDRPLDAGGDLVEIGAARLRPLNAWWWNFGWDWELHPRRLPNSMLYLPLDCPLELVVGEERTVLEPGRLALMPAHVTHAARFPGRPAERFTALCFHFALTDAYGRDLAARYPRRFLAVPGWPGCAPGLRRITEACHGGTADGRALVAAWLRTLLMELLLEAGRLRPVATPDRRIAGCLAQLDADQRAVFSVDELARLAGLGPRHFRTLFQRATGVLPKEFLMRRRIRAALALLEGGQDSIKTIAADLAFSSDHEFHACFRRFMGCTPSQWRRNPGAGG